MSPPILHDSKNPVRDPGLEFGRHRVLARSSNAPATERFAVVSPDPKDARFPGVTKFFRTMEDAETEAKRLHALDTAPAESAVRLVAEPVSGVTFRGGK